MPARIPVVQTGFEKSVEDAAKRVGRNLKINLGTSARDIKSLEQPLGRITGKADEFTKSMEAANARVLAFGASVGVLNAVVQSFKNLVSTTIEVEKSLSKINSILNASVPQLNNLKNQIFEIAKNTEQTFDVVAEAALELSRQGLSATEVTKRLNDSLILSRLSGINASEAVAGLTAAVNSFSKAGLTTGEVLNKISAAANKFAVSERDLIEAFKRSASVAEQAGVSIDELGGIITAVQQRTARGGAVIGNSFKTIFTRIGRAENLQLLSDLGVQITDVQGKILPATKLIENLAQKLEELDQVQVRSVTEKIGGGFQIAPLLAALSDYSSETSIAIQATQAFANATDEAYRKNEIQNQTLSAAINRTTLSVKELANALGELGVLDVFKNILSGLNSFTQGITKIFQGDDIGSKFAQGIIKGLGSTLITSGLALFGVIIGKLAIDLAKFGVNSLKTFLGLNKEAERLNNIQQQVVSTLLTDKNVRKDILAIEQSSKTVEEARARQAQFFTTALTEQLAVLKQMQAISASIAPVIGSTISTAGKTGAKRAAGGFLPVGAERSDISRGVGGAPTSAKPVVIPNFAFGGGKRGTMVANTSEYIVPNFAGGGSAIFNQDMVKSMGLPSGAKKINAAGGFVPNFAKTTGDFEKDLVSFKAGRFNRSALSSRYGKERVDKALGPAVATKTKTKTSTSSVLPIDGNKYGIAAIAKDLKQGADKTLTVEKSLGEFSKNKLAKELIGKGFKNLRFENVQVRSIDRRDVKTALEDNRKRILDYFLEPLANYGQEVLAGSGILRGNDLSDANKLIDTKKNKKLFSAGTEGGIFESAINLITKGFDGLSGIGDSETTPFDFEETGRASSEFKKTFGFTDVLRKADAKRTANITSVGSVIGKALRDPGEERSIKNQATRRLNTLQKKAASGYIPNFAMSPLEDAIQREKEAGVPVNQIRINQDGKLRNSQNPDGLAVTNTRDEPTGRIPQNAARGFVPNFIGTQAGVIEKAKANTSASGSSVDDLGKAADASVGKLLALSFAASTLGGVFGDVNQESSNAVKAFSGFTSGLLSAITTLSLIQTIAPGVKIPGQDKLFAAFGKGTKGATTGLAKFGGILLKGLPIVGTLFAGFQLVNETVKAVFGKGFFDLFKKVETPAEKAAKALDKLNTSALEAVAREGVTANTLGDFVKDLNTILTPTEKLGAGRAKGVKAGEVKFGEELLIQGGLGAAFELNRGSLLSGARGLRGLVSGDVTDKKVFGELTEAEQDAFIKATVEGKDVGKAVKREVIGELSPEQQRAQTRLVLGFAGLAEESLTDAINSAIQSGDPVLLQKALTDATNKLPEDLRKKYLEFSTKIKGDTLSSKDRENLADFLKLSNQITDSRSLVKTIELEISNIRRKSITDSAIQLSNLKSEVELAKELVLAKETSTEAEKISAKFQLDAINSQRKLRQEQVKTVSSRLESAKESLGLVEPGEQISTKNAALLNNLIQQANTQLLEQGKINKENIKNIAKEAGFNKQKLDILDDILSLSSEEVSALAKKENLERRISTELETQSRLRKLAVDEEKRALDFAEKKTQTLQKERELEIRRLQAQLAFDKATEDEKVIFGGQQAKFGATERKAGLEERAAKAIAEQQRQSTITNAATQALSDAVSAGLTKSLANIEAARGVSDPAQFKKFVDDLNKQFVDQQKAQKLALIDEQINQQQKLIQEIQIQNKFDSSVSDFGVIVNSLGTILTGGAAKIGVTPEESEVAKTKRQAEIDKARVELGNLLVSRRREELRPGQVTKPLNAEDLLKLLNLDLGIQDLELKGRLKELANSVEEAGGSLTTFANLVRNELNGIPERIAQAQFNLATTADPSQIQSSLVTLERERVLGETGDIGGANKAGLIFEKRLEIEAATDNATKERLKFELDKTLQLLDIREKILKTAEGSPERQSLIDEFINKSKEEQSLASKLRGSLFKTAEETRIAFDNALVSAATSFKDSLVDGVSSAISRGEGLKDVLLNAVNEFSQALLKASLTGLFDQILSPLSGKGGLLEGVIGGKGGSPTGSAVSSEESSVKQLLSQLTEGKLSTQGGPKGSQFDPIYVNVVNQAAGGIGATSGGGLISNIVGNIPIIGGIASKVTSFLGFNQGGMVSGGSGSKDDVPAMLMGGEYVMKKSAVNKYGTNFMDLLNGEKISKQVQQFANGGLVKKKEEEEFQTGEGGFFIPGTYGGAIKGKQNLLDFATQGFTEGTRDVMISGGDQSSGFAGVNLEAESLRLTNFGRRQGTPLQKATQQAKEDAFGAYAQQLGLEEQYREQLKAYKKSRRDMIRNTLISAAVSFGVNQLMQGFDLGSTNVEASGMEVTLPDGTVQAQTSSGQVLRDFNVQTGKGFLAQPTTLQKFGSGLKASIMGGRIPGGGDQTFSGLRNIANPRGRISTPELLQDYINKNPLEPTSYRATGFYYNRATGGVIPEQAGVDTVPAMLSGGEFIMNSAATERIGRDNLEKMNSGLSAQEESKSVGNDELIRKLDELIDATKESTGEINITVNNESDGRSNEQSSEGSNENTMLARKLKEEVIKIIQEEKRLGGTLRSDKL